MALSKKTRNILLVLGGLAILGGIAAVLGYVFVYNKAHPDYENIDPDYTLTSNEIYNEFASNEQQASQKFNGKIVQVKGSIESIGEGQGGNVQIILAAEGAMMAGVSAEMHNDYSEQGAHKSRVDKLQTGETVTLKCKCNGYDDLLGEVSLNNCYIPSK